MTDQPTTDEEATREPAEPAAPDPDAPDPAAPAPAMPAMLASDDVPTANEYTVAFSPRNVAVGLAIVAGLVGLIVRRRRRTKGS